MLTPEMFQNAIEECLAETGMKPTRFGLDAVGDPNFVPDIRNGRVPNLAVASKVLSFIERHRTRRSATPKGRAA